MRTYNTERKQGESLQKWYKRLAKAADQLLVRLENYSDQPYYKTAMKWAYRRAEKDIQKWDKKAGRDYSDFRFNRDMPVNEEELRSKISDIRQFIEAPTSTKQGITSVYKKRADTINQKYGTNWSWEDVAKFYESEEAKYWNEKYGSKTALRVIATIQKNKKVLQDDMKKVKEKDIKVEGKNKRLIKSKVMQALNDNQLDITSLF